MHEKKVLVFANAFTQLTGGDKHFIEVAKKGILKGWTIKVITTRSGYICCLKEGLNAEFYVIGSRFIDKLGLVISYLVRTIKVLIFILRKEKSAVVYSSSDSVPDILPCLLLRFIKRTSVWVSCIFHIIPNPFIRKGKFFRNLISYYAQRVSLILIKEYSDLTLVDNEILKDELIADNFSKQKVKVISMGVSKGLIDSIPQEEKIYDACFLGRLHPTKGIFDLVNIWGEVIKYYPASKLAVIGTGDRITERNLINSINNSNLSDNIIISKELDSEEVYKILKKSKVFILPSYEEGWGICVAEAMACGLPVVVYDLPVFRGLFPKGIIFVERGNWNAFAEAVRDLFSNPDQFNKLRQEGLKLVQQYDWDIATDKEWEEINKLAGKSIVSNSFF